MIAVYHMTPPLAHISIRDDDGDDVVDDDGDDDDDDELSKISNGADYLA